MRRHETKRGCPKTSATLAALLLGVSLIAVPSMRHPSAAAAPGEQPLSTLPDNAWLQLTLAPSARYLTPGFVLTPAPVPDPNPRTRAYSGLVAGDDRIFYFGGAHGSYPGNDVEIFDPRTLRWEQAYLPEVCPYTSPPAPCADIYNGWGTMLVTPLGRPYTEHTYQVYAYDPPRGRLLALLNNGTWAYDLSDRRWTALAGPVAGNTFSPVGIGTGNRHLFTFDVGLGAFQAVATSGPTRGVYRFDAEANRWARRGSLPEPGWTTMYSTYARDRGMHFVYATSWAQKWWKYESRNDQWTALPAPPDTADSFDYDRRNRVVVATTYSAGPLRVMVFDPDSSQWRQLPNDTQVPPMERTGRDAAPMAWRYVPAHNVFILLAGARGASAGGPTTTWAYRFKGGAAAAVPAPAADVTRSPMTVHNTASGPAAVQTFKQRCAQPGVVRCFGFDSAESIAPFLYPASDDSKPTFDPMVKASGAGSLRMTVPPLSKDNTSGAFLINFTPGSLPRSRTDPYPDQFGEGQEVYVQWRQRFSPEFLTNKWAAKDGGGWKQIIIGEGDRTGVVAPSCTQMDVVVNNYLYRGFPRMYHSCGGKDGQYQGLYEEIWHPGKTTPETRIQNMIQGCVVRNETVPPCVGYKPDQWMTFQVHIKIGTWYKNDRNYHRDSMVQLWIAEENKPPVLVISITGYDLANENPAAKFGKLWLTPFNTGKDPTVRYPVAYTWYDDLVISRTRIADPARESDNAAAR